MHFAAPVFPNSVQSVRPRFFLVVSLTRASVFNAADLPKSRIIVLSDLSQYHCKAGLHILSTKFFDLSVVTASNIRVQFVIIILT